MRQTGRTALRVSQRCASLPAEMRRIDKLLYLAIIPPFLSALTVLTFVVFIKEFGRLSELLISHNATPDVILMVAGAFLPSILIFSLPLSFLIGLLIGLSGLSGESQIIALRACGVPLRSLIRPVLVLGLMVGGLTALLSLIILPETNDRLFMLKDRISLRQATALVQPRVFNEDYRNLVLYLDDLAVDKQHWSRVFLSDNSDPKSPRTVLAREGSWVTDTQANRLQLHLQNGTIYEVDPDDAGKDKMSVFASTDIPVDVVWGNAAQNESNTDAGRKKRVSETATRDLWNSATAGSPQEELDQAIELQRRLAIPFSVLGFSLLGLTLGISTKKGGRTSGFVLSLLLVIIFYVLLINGLRLASIRQLSPSLGAWGANILLSLFGIILLATAERGNWLSSLVSNWHWKSRLEPMLGPVSHQLHLDAARSEFEKIDAAILRSTNKIARAVFPKILDIYVSRGFLVYFLWSIVTCSALFVVLTFFDLLDDILKNRIDLAVVVNYFVFLMPQILMLVVPMGVLLAILMNFGILEKFSEVTAIKAGGWSLYRIALPVLFVAGALSSSLYLIQDYVLPYANIRQDSLRNLIKGRPAQTSLRPQRKWIFGEESSRVFNYDYFDPGRNLFIGLNVFDIDFSDLHLLRRIHVERARIGDAGSWTLENGWLRDFRPGRQGFQRITKMTMPFQERSSYFQKEIFEPKESAKMSYLELKKYISYLKKSGFNATELQVELYKKTAFPLSCLVMSLVAIPFSFSMGKRGAFFGIAISIFIAISYWGVSGLFEKMGSYGLLIPFLAAWAPNLLFGAAGLALLFTIRT
jgi:LPS export ABC transporter permease LptG/LPS export ABC transporter permease LptF